MDKESEFNANVMRLYFDCIESHEKYVAYFKDRWMLTMERSCEMWLRGYFCHSKDKKLVNACIDYINGRHKMNIKKF